MSSWHNTNARPTFESTLRIQLGHNVAISCLRKDAILAVNRRAITGSFTPIQSQRLCRLI